LRRSNDWVLILAEILACEGPSPFSLSQREWEFSGGRISSRINRGRFNVGGPQNIFWSFFSSPLY
jgi:hypothetical protein